ncbi:MAG: hypothetical protein EXS31_00980 [Pedosphaera sp.]|nr:hypothetical protein [Pedosphaera sp.]
MKTPSLLFLLAWLGFGGVTSISSAVQAATKETKETPITGSSATAGTAKSGVLITAVGSPSAHLSSGIAEIVKMVEGGVEPTVIDAYIQNAYIPFSPSAAEIISLHELGVSSHLITALIRRGGELRAQQAQASKEMQSRLAQQQAVAVASNYQQAAPATYTPLTQPVSYNYYLNSYPSYAYSYPAYSYAYVGYPAYSYAAPFYSSYYFGPYRSYRYPVRSYGYCAPYSPGVNFGVGIGVRTGPSLHSSVRTSFGHQGRAPGRGR